MILGDGTRIASFNETVTPRFDTCLVVSNAFGDKISYGRTPGTYGSWCDEFILTASRNHDRCENVSRFAVDRRRLAFGDSFSVTCGITGWHGDITDELGFGQYGKGGTRLLTDAICAYSRGSTRWCTACRCTPRGVKTWRPP